jgi:hypothetical protein
MPELKRWRVYPPVEGITTFDANGEGPTVTSLQLTANTHASEFYPDTRVGLAIGGMGSLALTIPQVDALCAQLQRAKYDVHTGGVPVTMATGNEGRCDSCSQPIQAGDLVHAWGDDHDDDRVVVHAGRCPRERGDE